MIVSIKAGGIKGGVEVFLPIVAWKCRKISIRLRKKTQKYSVTQLRIFKALPLRRVMIPLRLCFIICFLLHVSFAADYYMLYLAY